MRIAAIDVSHHRLPLDPPFRPSWDFRPRTHFDATIVRVRTDDGLEGVGLRRHDDRLRRPRAPVRRRGPAAAGAAQPHPCQHPVPLRALLAARPRALGPGGERSPASRCGACLAGRSTRVAAYASSATLRDPGAQAEAAERYADAGFRGLKLRFHRGDWREDIKALEAVRGRVGDRLELMVDCNQGWRMSHDDARPWVLKDALGVARELERLGVYWMEEPLHRADRRGMRTLREMVDIRIAGGEMNRGAHRVPRPDRGALRGRAAAGRGADRRHHRPAPHRADGRGGGHRVHAAHLVERARLCRQRPFHRRPHRGAVPGVSLRPAGMVRWSAATS